MISLQEKEKLIKIVNHSRFPHRPERGRAGYCVITGYYDNKTLSEVCAYYMISEEDGLYWWNHFGFSEEMSKPTQKRSKNRNADIFNYLKEKTGEEITVKQFTEECSISSPTAYKFINENVGWFKKVKRGIYEIVDGDEERRKAKAK